MSGFTPFSSFLEQRFKPTPKWPNLDNTGEAEEAAGEQREFNYIPERLSNWVFGFFIWVCKSLRAGMRGMKGEGQARMEMCASGLSQPRTGSDTVSVLTACMFNGWLTAEWTNCEELFHLSWPSHGYHTSDSMNIIPSPERGYSEWKLLEEPSHFLTI